MQKIKKGTSDAEEITISFYVKANAAFNFVLEVLDATNNRACSKLFSTTTGWNRVEITYPADTTGEIVNSNAQGIRLFFWIHAGSTYTSGALNSSSFNASTSSKRASGISSFYSSTDNEFYLTGVQLEVGDTATPFEHRSYGEELALCQRYYQGSGRLIQTGDGVCGYLMASSLLPVEMRATPTAVIKDNAGNIGKVSADSSDNINGLVSGLQATMIAAGANNSVIGTNVFMSVHFTLEAEL